MLHKVLRQLVRRTQMVQAGRLPVFQNEQSLFTATTLVIILFSLVLFESHRVRPVMTELEER